MAHTSVSVESWDGPIPPPGLLGLYNDVVPDGAHRILVIFEEQARHRMQQENKVVSAELLQAKLGVAAALVVAIAGLIVAGWVSVNGHPTVGATISITDLVSLVSVFIYGTRSRKDERIKKTELMIGQQSRHRR